MKNIRMIARLDVKGTNLVKGVQLEGLRKIGDPNVFAKKYYEEGVDEIVYIDIVASLYNRNNLCDIVCNCTQNVFVPITVGGGIRSIEDADRILRCGADKIAINTAVVKNAKLIQKIADRFGSQCMVLSIQAKKVSPAKWEVYYDNGREKTGIDVVEWAKNGYNMGAGEILLTSIDNEGRQRGFDIDLIRAVADSVPIPVIACGGMGNMEDFSKAVISGHADAVAAASVLHYNKYSIYAIKENAAKNGINVRRVWREKNCYC